MTPTITAFEQSPDRGKGLARDMRVRWAFEEVGQPYSVRLLSFAALNLLEAKAVNYVHFDFVAGVHARPTTWSDKDFSDWKKDPSSVQ